MSSQARGAPATSWDAEPELMGRPSRRLREIASEERPRERLAQRGVAGLSAAEPPRPQPATRLRSEPHRYFAVLWRS